MRSRPGFSLLELVTSLVVMISLLALLVPALSSARAVARRDQCAANLGRIGIAIDQYLTDHDGSFPVVEGQAAWQWGGVRYSAVSEQPFIDTTRPLSRFISPYSVIGDATHLFCCPADRGISGETAHLGTGSRTACRAFGTSYRANTNLFDGARLSTLGSRPEPSAVADSRQPTADSPKVPGFHRSSITVAPSRLLVLGDAVWYEVYEQTGRDAGWHSRSSSSGDLHVADPASAADAGNILFLDGSVRFQPVRSKGRMGPIAIEPVVKGQD